MRRLVVFLTLALLLAVSVAAGWVAADWPAHCRRLGWCDASWQPGAAK